MGERNKDQPYRVIMILDRVLSAICPYQDKECPKIIDVGKLVEDNQRRLSNVEKLLYLIVGMIAVNWGVTLWR